jgi:hypothetical protein
MDQQQTDKFNELSPVLELVYVMMTNMVRYLDVYAKDIDAAKLEQYVEAKQALDNAIKKFDSLYGLQSTTVEEAETSDEVSITEPIMAAPPVAPQPQVSNENQPYDFASGADPESLKKAKQAVDELKTLFAEMKKKEGEIDSAPVMAEQAPVVAPQPPVEMQQEYVAPVQEQPAPVQVPTPMNTAAAAQPAKDASEIDSILAELRKLQNKGNAQL